MYIVNLLSAVSEFTKWDILQVIQEIFATILYLNISLVIAGTRLPVKTYRSFNAFTHCCRMCSIDPACCISIAVTIIYKRIWDSRSSLAFNSIPIRAFPIRALRIIVSLITNFTMTYISVNKVVEFHGVSGEIQYLFASL